MTIISFPQRRPSLGGGSISGARSVRSVTRSTGTSPEWDYDDVDSLYYASSLAASSLKQQGSTARKAKSLGVEVLPQDLAPTKNNNPNSAGIHKSQRRSAFFWDSDAPNSPTWITADEDSSTQENTESTAEHNINVALHEPVGATTANSRRPSHVGTVGGDSLTNTQIYLEDGTTIASQGASRVLSPADLEQIVKEAATSRDKHKAETASSISASLMQCPLEISIPVKRRFPAKPLPVQVPLQEPSVPAIPKMTPEELARQHHRNVLQEHRRRRQSAGKRNDMSNVSFGVATANGKIRQTSLPNFTLSPTPGKKKRPASLAEASFAQGGSGRLSKSSNVALGGSNERNEHTRLKKEKHRLKARQQRQEQPVEWRDQVRSSGMNSRRLLVRRSHPQQQKEKDEGVIYHREQQHQGDSPCSNPTATSDNQLLVVTTTSGEVELMQVPQTKRRKRGIVVRFLKASWKFLCRWTSNSNSNSDSAHDEVVIGCDAQSDDDGSCYYRQQLEQRRDRQWKRRGSF